jgi:hypothetical protein
MNVSARCFDWSLSIRYLKHYMQVAGQPECQRKNITQSQMMLVCSRWNAFIHVFYGQSEWSKEQQRYNGAIIVGSTLSHFPVDVQWCIVPHIFNCVVHILSPSPCDMIMSYVWAHKQHILAQVSAHHRMRNLMPWRSENSKKSTSQAQLPNIFIVLS